MDAVDPKVIARRKRGREWYLRHREEQLIRSKKARLNRKEYYAKWQKNWRLSSSGQEYQRVRNCRRMGITVEKYDSMLASQGYKCANRHCGVEHTSAAKLYIDHDHTTGVVRGLLCRRCNFAIGHARDSYDVLIGLAQYIGGR